MTILLLALLLPALSAQDATPTPPPDTTAMHFRVYTPDGEAVSLNALFEAMDAADAVFVGEQHDDPMAHHLERMLLEGAFTRFAGGEAPRPVVLALEMFERDVQTVLDEYLAGWIREKDFLEAGRPWRNYESDYRPMVEFARAHGLPVVAANAPGRYVSLVGRSGPDSLAVLSPEARAWLPPLPVAPASDSLAAAFRRTMAEMMASFANRASSPDSTASDSTASDSTASDSPSAGPAAPKMPAMEQASEAEAPVHTAPADSAVVHSVPVHTAPADTTPAAPRHGSSYMLEAQNLRDAAMGYSVAEALEAHPGALVLHVNGSFHSNRGLGTPEHLRRHDPDARILVVSLVSEGFPDFDPETMGDLGDFIILTDPALPRTFASGF